MLPSAAQARPRGQLSISRFETSQFFDSGLWKPHDADGALVIKLITTCAISQVDLIR